MVKSKNHDHRKTLHVEFKLHIYEVTPCRTIRSFLDTCIWTGPISTNSMLNN